MHEIEASTADDGFGQLLDRVEAGEEIAILRRGRTVAHLVPPRTEAGGEGALAAAAAIRAMSRGVTLGDVSLKELVAEGRR